MAPITVIAPHEPCKAQEKTVAVIGFQNSVSAQISFFAPERHTAQYAGIARSRLIANKMCRSIPFSPYSISSSGVKSSVMDLISVRIWIYRTPAESIIRLDAMVARVSAYLSER